MDSGTPRSNMTSAPPTAPPVYSPAPADLNLDGAGKPLSFSSAIRGPHGKEWTLADEQDCLASSRNLAMYLVLVYFCLGFNLACMLGLGGGGVNNPIVLLTIA